MEFAMLRVCHAYYRLPQYIHRRFRSDATNSRSAWRLRRESRNDFAGRRSSLCFDTSKRTCRSYMPRFSLMMIRAIGISSKTSRDLSLSIKRSDLRHRDPKKGSSFECEGWNSVRLRPLSLRLRGWIEVSWVESSMVA